MNNFFVTDPIKLPLGSDILDVKEKLARLLRVKTSCLKSLRLRKKSVDARDKSAVHFVCSYVVECVGAIPKNATPFVACEDLLESPKTSVKGSCIVVGAGPSGLFLARYLTLRGVQVTVVERGSDIEKRRAIVKTFFEGGELDENCNVQFGLGGAGTFSDGKLTTGISSPLLNTVFSEFIRCGAPKDIAYSALPHIGTDKLVSVVSDMKSEIEKHGGAFLFDTLVSDVITENGKAVGVVCNNDGGEVKLYADCVALCCGHSAGQLFHTLVKHGVDICFKPFAVGLRVEHTRQFINKTQYGELFATHRDLEAASYKLVNNQNNRSCYSFCMCPGGVVVCASSERQTVVVNGMSDYARDAANSNSALVVTVSAQDVADFGFGNDAFSGFDFQCSLEQAAYRLGGGNYVAPCQNVTDFLSGKVSQSFDIAPSYQRGVKSCNLRALLPKEIGDCIAESLEVFNRRMKGFAEYGVLTGVETRTSSPVKVLRDENMQSSVTALFPVGEGAGYAGGIVSSAVDGLKTGIAIVDFLNNK